MSKTVYQKPVQKSAKSGPESGTGFKQEKYGRTPDSVLYDKSITLADRAIYTALAREIFQGNTVRIGQRLLARKLGVSKTTINDSIQELARKGHIVIAGEGKARRIYLLTSNRFGAKQRAMDAGEDVREELVSGPRRRLAVARKKAC